MQRVFQGPVEVRVVEGEKFLPPGLRPAFAYKGDYLVFGSSPEAILRFEPPAANDTALTADEVPLVRLALAGWAKYVRTYREPLAAFAAEAHHLDLLDVQRRLDRLLKTLELFDRIEVTQRTQSNRATVTLRLQTAAALQSP
jgi:hypothetical protein